MAPMDTSIRMSRRHALLGMGAVAAGSAVVMPRLARAQPVTHNTTTPQQGAGFYRFKVGEIECFSIGDSQAMFPSFPLWGENASQQAVSATLKASALKPDALRFHFNVLMLKNGSERWLVDAGNGANPNWPGQLTRHLGTLGVRPDDISGVILSHLHSDHYMGLTDEAGKLVFPNARYMLNRVERDFWSGTPDLSMTNLAPEWKAGQTAGAKQILDALDRSGKLEIVDDGSNITTGVRVRQTGGHTPGHQSVIVESGGEKFEMLVDVLHHFIMSVQRPDWHAHFDYDAKEGARVRREVLERTADEGTLVMCYHTPWPGVARIVRDGDEFRWMPIAWEW